MALFPTSMHVISVNVLDLSSLVSWCQPFSSDSRKNRTGNIVPDTEDCSRKCCQRACRKICSRKGNGKSAVLHSDFNCDCCCLGIFNMKYFCCQKAKSHTAQIVDRHNNQYKHTAAYNFSALMATIPEMIITIDTTEISGSTSEIFQFAFQRVSGSKFQEVPGSGLLLPLRSPLPRKTLPPRFLPEYKPEAVSSAERSKWKRSSYQQKVPHRPLQYT